MKFLTLFLWTSSLFALPIGNTLAPALYDQGLWDCRTPIFRWGPCIHVRFGYYGDFVFNRDVEEIVQGDPSGDIHQMTLATNGGTLTLDICDYLDLFLMAGATRVSYNSEGMFGDYVYYDFSTRPSWSLGAALDLWECGCFGLGLEVQYFQTRPLLNSFTNLATGQMIYFNELNRMKWREWQGGATASYSFCTCDALCLVPYMGIKAATGTLKQHAFQFVDDGLVYTLNRLESKKVWGYALGMTALSSGILGATVEGRWADEKALYVNMQLSY